VVIPTHPPSPIIGLIFSFPLLEDLAVIVYNGMSADNGDGFVEGEVPATVQPSSPHMFTGSHELCLKGGMERFLLRLLSPPGGIRFQELTLTSFHDEDLSLTTALVGVYSRTLESLDITWDSLCRSSLRLPPH
jgi:hypothetical protein